MQHQTAAESQALAEAQLSDLRLIAKPPATSIGARLQSLVAHKPGRDPGSRGSLWQQGQSVTDDVLAEPRAEEQAAIFQ